MYRFRSLAIALLACALASPTFAQDLALLPNEPPATTVVPAETPAPPAPQRRPRIALVLGGGGARGFAHIGVLEWFEKHHIPIDYIVGTSIGGLVGGTYACGTSTSEIRRLINGINWSNVFTQDGPYPLLGFRRKEDSREFSVDFTLGLKGGFSVPAGLYPAQPVNLLLARISLPYTEAANFDELPIPFRCVSGDIVSGDEVIFRNGSLPEAMRATMAIPGVFTPVRRKGQILVDGMIVNNVPADVARDEFKPDYIIAVDVGTPLANEEQLDSALAISGQALSVMIVNVTKEKLKSADLVLSPNLDKKYSTTSFTKLDEIAPFGYAACEAKSAELSKLSVDDATYSAYVAERDAKRRSRELVPKFVDVQGTTADAVRIVEDGFKPYLGKPLSVARLDEMLTRIMGTGRYESVTYGISEKNGESGLAILITEKRYAPPFIRFGLDLSNQQASGADINFNARLTFLDLLKYGDEARIDVGLGDDNILSGEYYYRVGRSKFFVAPYALAESSSSDLYVNEDRVARYGIKNFGIGADVGVNINRFSEIRAGYEFQNVRAKVSIGDPLLPELTGNVNSVRGKYILDRANSAQINTDGYFFEGNYRHYFNSEAIPSDADRADARFTLFKPISGRHILGVRASGGTAFKSDLLAPFDFTLGGPFRMSAYGLNEFRGRNYYYISPTYLYRLGTLPEIFGGAYYLGVIYEAGAAYNTWDTHDTKNDGAVGFLMETKLGTFTVGGAGGENGRGRIFFTFGPVLRR